MQPSVVSQGARAQRRIFVRTAIAVLSILALPGDAVAEGRIAGVRTSSRPEFDRIVLDLGSDTVDAEQLVDAERIVLALGADAPQLSGATSRTLSRFGTEFVPAERGSQLVIERAGKNVRVFRLAGNPATAAGERLVIDIGPVGGEVLALPGDAAQVPARLVERQQQVAAAPPRTAQPAPARTAPSAPARTPTPSPPPARTPARAAKRPAAPTPAAKSAEVERQSSASGQEFRVLVRDISITGVDDPAVIEALGQLTIPVTPIDGGYIAPRRDAPVLRLPLAELAGVDGNGRTLTSDVLGMVVQTMADAYAAAGRQGVTIRIPTESLSALLAPENPGRLLIQVENPEE